MSEDYSYTRTLRAALKGTDKIDVWADSNKSVHAVCLFSEVNPARIAGILDHLEVDESHYRTGDHCMCNGEFKFQFINTDALRPTLAEISLHHGQSLRWLTGTWLGDGQLTDGSASYLCEWLADHGHDGAKRERNGQEDLGFAHALIVQMVHEIITTLAEMLKKEEPDRSSKEASRIIEHGLEEALREVRRGYIT